MSTKRFESHMVKISTLLVASVLLRITQGLITDKDLPSLVREKRLSDLLDEPGDDDASGGREDPDLDKHHEERLVNKRLPKHELHFPDIRSTPLNGDDASGDTVDPDLDKHHEKRLVNKGLPKHELHFADIRSTPLNGDDASGGTVDPDLDKHHEERLVNKRLPKHELHFPDIRSTPLNGDDASGGTVDSDLEKHHEERLVNKRLHKHELHFADIESTPLNVDDQDVSRAVASQDKSDTIENNVKLDTASKLSTTSQSFVSDSTAHPTQPKSTRKHHHKVILPGVRFGYLSQEVSTPAPPSRDAQHKLRLRMKRKKRKRLRALKRKIDIKSNSNSTRNEGNSLAENAKSVDASTQVLEVSPSSSRTPFSSAASNVTSLTSKQNTKRHNQTSSNLPTPSLLVRSKRILSDKEAQSRKTAIEPPSSSVSSSSTTTKTSDESSSTLLPPSLAMMPSQDLMILNDFFNHKNTSKSSRKNKDKVEDSIADGHSEESANQLKQKKENVKDTRKMENDFAIQLLEFQKKRIKAEEKKLDEESGVNVERHSETLQKHNTLRNLDRINDEKEDDLHGLFDKLKKTWKHNKTRQDHDEILGKDDVKNLRQQDHGKSLGKQDDEFLGEREGFAKRRRRKMHRFSDGTEENRRNGTSMGSNDISDEIMEFAIYDKKDEAVRKHNEKDDMNDDEIKKIHPKEGRTEIIDDIADLPHSTDHRNRLYNADFTKGNANKGNKGSLNSETRKTQSKASPPDEANIENAFKDIKSSPQTNTTEGWDIKNQKDIPDDVETTLYPEDDGGPVKKEKNTTQDVLHKGDSASMMELEKNIDIVKNADQNNKKENDNHNYSENQNNKNIQKSNNKEEPKVDDHKNIQKNGTENDDDAIALAHDKRLLYILTGEGDEFKKPKHTVNNKGSHENTFSPTLGTNEGHKPTKPNKQINENNVNTEILNTVPKGMLINKQLKLKVKEMENRVLNAHHKVNKDLEQIEKELSDKFYSLQGSVLQAKSLTINMDSKINSTVLNVMNLAKSSAAQAKAKLELVQKAAAALNTIEDKMGANETRHVARVLKSKIPNLPIQRNKTYQRILALNNIIARMDGAKIIAVNKANTSYDMRSVLEKSMSEEAGNVLQEIESTEKELKDDTEVEMEDEMEADKKIKDAKRRNYKAAVKTSQALRKIEKYIEKLESDERKLRILNT